MTDALPPATAQPHRIAAIDVGTNSIRLIVAEANDDGGYRVLDDEKETARLGQGLETTGRMAPEAIERAAGAIERMKKIAEGFGIETLRAIGTSAVRDATNRDEFLGLVQQRTGIVVEPILAEEEAQLVHISVSHAFDLRNQAVAVVDIGGGSTEVILSSGGVVEQVYPLPLGAVRLTERYGGPERAAGDHYRKMRRAIRRVLKRTIRKPPFTPQMLIGTGGTFTSLANISRHRAAMPGGNHLPPASVRGYEMNRSELRHLIDWLRELPLRTRQRVPGLSPERADIIVAGATIIERVMKHLGVNRLRVHDGGVRDGLIRTMISSMRPAAGGVKREPLDPLHSARQFAATCGYEERHCHHVAQLAGQMFDQLANRFPAGPGSWADPANRPLLEAAALLKDVGYLINYSKHHHHSYHLIIHSELSGFAPREVQLVANIARYHRGARPKASHPNFAQLAKPERDVVRHLAAILRIADGLDRNRTQNVRRVGVRVEKGTATFVLEAAENPTVEIWEALSKAKLFEKVFRAKPDFKWVAPGKVGTV